MVRKEKNARRGSSEHETTDVDVDVDVDGLVRLLTSGDRTDGRRGVTLRRRTLDKKKNVQRRDDDD